MFIKPKIVKVIKYSNGSKVVSFNSGAPLTGRKNNNGGRKPLCSA